MGGGGHKKKIDARSPSTPISFKAWESTCHSPLSLPPPTPPESPPSVSAPPARGSLASPYIHVAANIYVPLLYDSLRLNIAKRSQL